MADSPQTPDTFKTLVWDAFVQRGLDLLFSTVPWLAWGPLGAIVGWLGRLLCDQLYSLCKQGGNVFRIQIENQVVLSKYNETSPKLKLVFLKYGEDSKEFQDAHAEDQKAFFDLIRFHI